MVWRLTDGNARSLCPSSDWKPLWLAEAAVRWLALQRYDRARADAWLARSVRGLDGEGRLSGRLLLFRFPLSGTEFRHTNSGFLALLGFLDIIGRQCQIRNNIGRDNRFVLSPPFRGRYRRFRCSRAGKVSATSEAISGALKGVGAASTMRDGAGERELTKLGQMPEFQWRSPHRRHFGISNFVSEKRGVSLIDQQHMVRHQLILDGNKPLYPATMLLFGTGKRIGTLGVLVPSVGVHAFQRFLSFEDGSVCRGYLFLQALA